MLVIMDDSPPSCRPLLVLLIKRVIPYRIGHVIHKFLCEIFRLPALQIMSL